MILHLNVTGESYTPALRVGGKDHEGLPVHKDHIIAMKGWPKLLGDGVAQRECFHYLNLQLLSERDNLQKGAKKDRDRLSKPGWLEIMRISREQGWADDGWVMRGCDK